MEINDLFVGGASVTGVISAIFFILILAVKPLREKLVEYIILKHDKTKGEEALKKAMEKIDTLQNKVDMLVKENVNLKVEVAELRTLLESKK